MATKQLKRTIYFGTFIHNTSLAEFEVLENAAIGIDEKGIIAFIEKNVREENIDAFAKQRGWNDCDVVRGTGQGTTYWFPGFIDTHIHASQLPNAGIFGKSTLLSWLETYTYPLESSFSSLSTANRIYSHCIKRTLASGTTTAAYYATIHAPATNRLATLCHTHGQRAFIGRCNMDSHIHPSYYVDASAEAAIADTRATIDHIRSLDPEFKLISPIITPRFAPSCTPALLSALGSLHKETNLPIQTHISENTAEMGLVKEMFPDHASYADVYDAFGLLTSKTVLAHACHLSPDEIGLVRDRGAKVAHCPVSNSFLSSGICPVRDLLDAGVDVGLGTDVSGGYSPSVLVAAREAGGVSRIRVGVCGEEVEEEKKERMKLGVVECLYLATRGGAKVLGLEGIVGGWEVGMEWDAQFVDLGRVVDAEGEGGKGGVSLWGKEGWEEKLAKWVFCGDERNTRAVWVGGRLVSGGMDKDSDKP